jgi:hypothetical protein
MAEQKVDLRPGDTLAVRALEAEPPLPDPPEPEPEPEPVRAPTIAGQPKFSLAEGGVRVDWTPAERATHYEVTRKGAASFTVDQNFAIVPAMGDGDWLCVMPMNGDVPAADPSCNRYKTAEVEPAPDPDPLPPIESGWTLVHDFSPAKGQTLPAGVVITLKDGSWVPGGKAERTADGYLMTYLKGMEDGRGPGRIGIERSSIPQGHRRGMFEFDVELSANFEDQPVYNKISHHRFDPPASGGAGKNITRFKGYRLSLTGKPQTRMEREWEPVPYTGYDSAGANILPELRLSVGMHTVRIAMEWDHTDAVNAEVNWYRGRWWIDGQAQGDHLLPIFGGPEFRYWEIAPTWGGDGGHVKQREDWMLISRVKTWVG